MLNGDWSIGFLRVEALCRCGVSDDGVVQVTEQYPGDGSLRFAKQNPDGDSSSLVTGTSLTHQLGVVHLLHTGGGRGEMGQGNKDRRKGGKGTKEQCLGEYFVSSRGSQRFTDSGLTCSRVGGPGRPSGPTSVPSAAVAP